MTQQHIAPQFSLALPPTYGVTDTGEPWTGTTDALNTLLEDTAKQTDAIPNDRLFPEGETVPWIQKLPDSNRRACQGTALLYRRVQLSGSAFAGLYRQFVAWIHASQIRPDDLRKTLITLGVRKERVSEFESIAFRSDALVSDFLTGKTAYKPTLAKIRALKKANKKAPEQHAHDGEHHHQAHLNAVVDLPAPEPVDIHLKPHTVKGRHTWTHRGLVAGAKGAMLDFQASLRKHELTASFTLDCPPNQKLNIHLIEGPAALSLMC